MWEDLADKYRNEDLTWLVKGLRRGTIEWCTDGSYHRGIAPNISDAGWICCSTDPVITGEQRRGLKGNFWGKSNSKKLLQSRTTGRVRHSLSDY